MSQVEGEYDETKDKAFSDSDEQQVSGTVGTSFKSVVKSLSSLFLPNISENIIRQVVISNLPPKFITEFNERMKDEQYQQDVNQAVNNLKEYYKKILSVIQEPINDAVYNITENVVPKLVGSVSRTASTAVFNIASAIPGVGAVISAARLLNTAGDTASNMSNTVDQIRSTINTASGAILKGLQELDRLTKGQVSKSVQQKLNEMRTLPPPAPTSTSTQEQSATQGQTATLPLPPQSPAKGIGGKRFSFSKAKRKQSRNKKRRSKTNTKRRH